MTQIDDVVHSLFTSLDAKDTAGICSLLVDDAAMVDEITKGWMVGRETLRQHLDATFAGVEAIASNVRDLRVRATGDFATATCTLLQRYTLNGQTVDVVAPTSMSFERSNGEWLIVTMHAIPLAD